MSTSIEELRQQIQTIIDNNAINERTDWPGVELPERFFYYDFTHLPITITMNETPLTAKKIRLVIHPKFIVSDKQSLNTNSGSQAILYITTQNKEHEERRPFVFELKDKSQIITLYEQMKKAGAKPFTMFSRKGEEALAWNEFTANEIYQMQPSDPHTSYYEKLHTTIQEFIIDAVISKQGLHEINIIDGGCGNGLFLQSLENKLSRLFPNLTMHLVGFDFNENNIKYAQSNHQETIAFSTGDLTKVDRFMEKCKEQRWINEESPTVLVLSGSLTRLVLRGGFQGLDALQSIGRSQQIDYMVGGGIGEPLINRYIAKQIGYLDMDEQTTDETTGKWFAFKQMSLAERIHKKIHTLHQHKTLDFALCPNPNQILLNVLDHLKLTHHEIEAIDLSFTQLSDDLMTNVETLINANPEIKLICTHYSTDVLQELEELVYKTNCPFSLNIAKNESYLLASQRFFQQFHTQSNGTKYPSVLFSIEINPDEIISEKRIKQVRNSTGNILFAAHLITKYAWQLAGIKNKKELKNILKEKITSSPDPNGNRIIYRERQLNLSQSEGYWFKTLTPTNTSKIAWEEIDEGSEVDEDTDESYDKEIKETSLPYCMTKLEHSVFEEKNIADIALLIHLRQEGIALNIEYSQSDYVSSGWIGHAGSNFVEEIKLYLKLSITFPDKFPKPFVEALCEKRIEELKTSLADSGYRITKEERSIIKKSYKILEEFKNHSDISKNFRPEI